MEQSQWCGFCANIAKFSEIFQVAKEMLRKARCLGSKKVLDSAWCVVTHVAACQAQEEERRKACPMFTIIFELLREQ